MTVIQPSRIYLLNFIYVISPRTTNVPKIPVSFSCKRIFVRSVDPVNGYLISYRNAKKGKPDEMDLPLLKNDITGSEPTVKMLDT